jgi:Protein of unknown function (DUF4236)
MGASIENLHVPVEGLQMGFKFRKRKKITPGLSINLSKGWPSLSIGGTINVGRSGHRASVGIPGSGSSWQIGGHRHIHKAVQVQSDVRAVHAQGTIKAVQAQAAIIAITKRMETLAKRLTRNAAGSSYWKRAAIEQAQLLDKMLDVAKESENSQLIAAVRKCHEAWGDGDPHLRAALNSGLTVTECLEKVLAGNRLDPNHPVTINNLKEPAVHGAFSNPDRWVLEQKPAERSIDEPVFRSSLWKALGRNVVLPLLGGGVIATVYLIAVHKTTSHPPVIESATPTPVKPVEMPASQTVAVTPAPQLSTPAPSPVEPTPTPSPSEHLIHRKTAGKKHSSASSHK